MKSNGEENNCDCKLKRIIDDAEKIVLVSCLKVMDNKDLKDGDFALIDQGCSGVSDFECKHLLSLGFDYYCCHQDQIKKFMGEEVHEQNQ